MNHTICRLSVITINNDKKYWLISTFHKVGMSFSSPYSCHVSCGRNISNLMTFLKCNKIIHLMSGNNGLSRHIKDPYDIMVYISILSVFDIVIKLSQYIRCLT